MLVLVFVYSLSRGGLHGRLLVLFLFLAEFFQSSSSRLTDSAVQSSNFFLNFRPLGLRFLCRQIDKKAC